MAVSQGKTASQMEGKNLEINWAIQCQRYPLSLELLYQRIVVSRLTRELVLKSINKLTKLTPLCCLCCLQLQASVGCCPAFVHVAIHVMAEHLADRRSTTPLHWLPL
ncbi:hypothetical protein PVAP13_6KG038735 [Panicum virgatum]|uniref:Uncharacterized protein n=1 Tax=Panicum virgatum TaxID=38727 RepID=A0A8T0R707_PANVG|nr:hypothetical protein PVAP13_6KG038735 [Panicum virgatum]